MLQTKDAFQLGQQSLFTRIDREIDNLIEAIAFPQIRQRADGDPDSLVRSHVTGSPRADSGRAVAIVKDGSNSDSVLLSRAFEIGLANVLTVSQIDRGVGPLSVSNVQPGRELRLRDSSRNRIRTRCDWSEQEKVSRL